MGQNHIRGGASNPHRADDWDCTPHESDWYRLKVGIPPQGQVKVRRRSTAAMLLSQLAEAQSPTERDAALAHLRSFTVRLRQQLGT